MNILEAIDDEALFAAWFVDRKSYRAWRAFLKAAFGLPMDAEERGLFKHHTGRQEPPTAPHEEIWLICGRRGGKSFHMALLAVFLAVFRDYRPYLARGERATIRIMAADRKQARVTMRYIAGLLKGVPMLAELIEGETKESFDLARSVTIETGTASMKTSRGYSFAAILADEVAFWEISEESAEPDVEVLNAVRPGLASIPGSVLICASSPYAKKGALFEAYRRYWGKDGAPLVWRGATREMNPTIPQKFIDAELEKDEASARAEYFAEFRSDISDFLTLEQVEACIDRGVHERPPDRQHVYFSFTDPSGGSSDAMTLAIAHVEGRTVVLDCIREAPSPFTPDAVVAEFVHLLRSYNLSYTTGDRYAGTWIADAFRKAGCFYVPVGNAAGPVEYGQAKLPSSKSEIYIDVLPVFNSRAVVLLDHPKLVRQLVGLERRTHRGGRDSVDHAPNSHDDIANAVCGAISLAARHTKPVYQAIEKTKALAPGIYGRPDGSSYAVLPPDPNVYRNRSGRMKI